MVEFLMEYLKAHTEQDDDDSSVMSDEEMLVSPFNQASALSFFQIQKHRRSCIRDPIPGLRLMHSLFVSRSKC